jgi:hypothetical protein
MPFKAIEDKYLNDFKSNFVLDVSDEASQSIVLFADFGYRN